MATSLISLLSVFLIFLGQVEASLMLAPAAVRAQPTEQFINGTATHYILS
jgi:hypothetical protein